MRTRAVAQRRPGCRLARADSFSNAFGRYVRNRSDAEARSWDHALEDRLCRNVCLVASRTVIPSVLARGGGVARNLILFVLGQEANMGEWICQRNIERFRGRCGR